MIHSLYPRNQKRCVRLIQGLCVNAKPDLHRKVPVYSISKWCSFGCDVGKYSTCPMNKMWAFRRTPYSLDICCIFQYRTKNEQLLYFLTRSSHTWYTQHTRDIEPMSGWCWPTVYDVGPTPTDVRLTVKTTAQSVRIENLLWIDFGNTLLVVAIQYPF